MGSKPSYIQQMLLFQLVAGLTLAGSQTSMFLLCIFKHVVSLQLTSLMCIVVMFCKIHKPCHPMIDVPDNG